MYSTSSKSENSTPNLDVHNRSPDHQRLRRLHSLALLIRLSDLRTSMHASNRQVVNAKFLRMHIRRVWNGVPFKPQVNVDVDVDGP